MQFKKVKLIVFLLLILRLTGLHAQEAIITSGGDASGSTGSVSFTVGQVIYTTTAGTTGSVSQGVQQPYEISVVTGIEEPNLIILSVSAYPNPATDYLILKVVNFANSDLSFHLYDLNGRLLVSNKIESDESKVVMKNYLPSTYFLRIIENKKVIKNFKIIKNQ